MKHFYLIQDEITREITLEELNELIHNCQVENKNALYGYAFIQLTRIESDSMYYEYHFAEGLYE